MRRLGLFLFMTLILTLMLTGCTAKNAPKSEPPDAPSQELPALPDSPPASESPEPKNEVEPISGTYTCDIRASVRDGMPEYRFVATGEPRFEGDEYSGFVTGLAVYDENGQPILLEDFSEAGYAVYIEMMDTMGLHVTDVNFDGYKDVIVLNTFFGAHANTWYDCWLWDAAASSFAREKSFADICNPALDRENECIYSSGGSGAGIRYSSIYRFIGGEFVVSNTLLIESLWVDENGNELTDPESYSLRITEQQLKDGELTTIREQFVPPEQSEDELEYYSTDGLWQLDNPRWYMVGGHEADKWLEG